MVKVALINPPVPDQKNWVREGRCQQLDIWGAPFPPLTLALISRELVNQGNETILIDAGPEKKNLAAVLKQIGEFSPSLIVLTLSTPTIETDLNWFVSELKKAHPGILVAGVGIHVSALPKETLSNYPQLDFVVVGEPEKTIGELVARKMKDLSLVASLGYRDAEGGVRLNETRPFMAEIDSLGLPDWAKIDFRNYQMPIVNKPFSLVHFARGCPYRCNYCTAHTYNGRSFRVRSVGSLIEELEYNMSLGVHDFLFWTEMLTFDADYLNELLDTIIAKGLHEKIRWVCNSRVDTVRPELLKKMKMAGCWQIAFGFEFGSDEFLKIANKGGKASVALAREAAQMAHEAGLVVDGHFMLGYPGETESHMQKTIDLALSLPLTFSHFYAVVPYPGAEIYDNWASKNNQVKWRDFDQRIPLIESKQLSPQTVMAYKKKAYRKFYLRPVVAARIMKIPRRMTEYFNVARSSTQAFRALIVR